MSVKQVVKTNAPTDYERYLARIGKDNSLLLKTPEDFIDDFLNYDNALLGDRSPWGPTHASMAFGPGQVSIWAGINGHGKSELAGQVMSWLMPTAKVAIASFEMKPAETLIRMCKQTLGATEPTRNLKEAWIDWATNRMYIYDLVDRVTPESVLGMVHYSHHELGCRHIVIDSLTKCGVGRDFEKQALFVDDLQNAAKRWGAHIHLIAHMRKGESETQKPGKFDLRGAAEISDLADNVLIVFRNKIKEEMIQSGKTSIEINGEQILTDKALPDTILRHVKNRHGGEELDYKLWRNASGQYCSTPERRITHPEERLITGHFHESYGKE
jgi:twinkle protein